MSGTGSLLPQRRRLGACRIRGCVAGAGCPAPETGIGTSSPDPASRRRLICASRGASGGASTLRGRYACTPTAIGIHRPCSAAASRQVGRTPSSSRARRSSGASSVTYHWSTERIFPLRRRARRRSGSGSTSASPFLCTTPRTLIGRSQHLWGTVRWSRRLCGEVTAGEETSTALPSADGTVVTRRGHMGRACHHRPVRSSADLTRPPTQRFLALRRAARQSLGLDIQQRHAAPPLRGSARPARG